MYIHNIGFFCNELIDTCMTYSNLLKYIIFHILFFVYKVKVLVYIVILLRNITTKIQNFAFEMRTTEEEHTNSRSYICNILLICVYNVW